MGYKFTVSTWTKIDDPGEPYVYIVVYEGDDFDEALAKMREEKHKGASCVKLEWRGGE